MFKGVLHTIWTFTSKIDTGTYISPLGVWRADFDNSGTIDYGEFLAVTMHLNKLEREREENVLLAFSFFDKDGSGYITIDKLQQACQGFGLCDIHLEEMIKEIDQDKVSLIICICFYFLFLRYN